MDISHVSTHSSLYSCDISTTNTPILSKHREIKLLAQGHKTAKIIQTELDRAH